ncbi:MAG: hypothetical protein LBV23_00320 [Deltaproteobacteria bacterium]|jgi:hypothetical protein|nr:hypothetical protein [Deltaproteobacteria bacterium]
MKAPGPENLSPQAHLNSKENLNFEEIEVFNRLTRVELTEEERRLAVTPIETAQDERRLMAIHFHPEWTPIEFIEARLKRAFPKADDTLIIPTQHNQIMTMGPWAGVEADVFSPSLSQKIQLLIHFKSSALTKAGPLMEMMERTFSYRALQLLDVIEALSMPDSEIQKELLKTGLAGQALEIASQYALKVAGLVESQKILGSQRSVMLKNRLLSDFIQALGKDLPPSLMGEVLSLIKLIKGIVKKRLRPTCFFSAQEVIEEARSIDAGVVIPHPPVFWPVLLDDLDVDGWEVWNPSTPSHAVFLINCLSRAPKGRRPLLAFMGDDTHMSSKIRPKMLDDKVGSESEIGFQHPWFDAKVQQALKAAGQSRERTMDEYRSRLS